MSFTLKDILGGEAPTIARLRCPLDKVAFYSKAEALARAKVINRTELTNVTPFRCDYCSRWHLGHRRGAIR